MTTREIYVMRRLLIDPRHRPDFFTRSEAREIGYGRWQPPNVCNTFPSVFLRHQFPAFERALVAVGALFGAFRQGNLRARHLLVTNHAQQVRDAVEPCPTFVIRTEDVPRRMPAVGGFEHLVSRP